MRLLLIRHPKPAIEPGVCYGRLDVPAEPGEAERLVRALARREAPGLVFSSPLQRCAAVARAMGEAGWPQPEFDPRLAEMHFGDWEGRSWDDIGREQVDAWAADIAGYVPPGGESVRMLAQRAADFAADLARREPGGEVAIFTHAGVIQTLPRMLRGEPLEGFARTRIGYASVTVLELRGGRFETVAIGEEP